jgi:DNA-directed RNA polymerase specialized sigma24 family protein
MPPYANSTTMNISSTALEDLYSCLRSRSIGLASNVSSLQGQERDAEEDFVQESVVRVYEYSLRPDYEKRAIKSLKLFTITTMRNYREDTRRKNHRNIRLVQLQPSIHQIAARGDQVDPSEIAIENVFREQLFLLIVPEIVRFPFKQKEALLIDLANHSCFDEEPALLERAFLREGIRLQDYQQPLPEDPTERSRFSSNLNHAYKRIANLECVKRYIAL